MLSSCSSWRFFEATKELQFGHRPNSVVPPLHSTNWTDGRTCKNGDLEKLDLLPIGASDITQSWVFFHCSAVLCGALSIPETKRQFHGMGLPISGSLISIHSAIVQTKKTFRQPSLRGPFCAHLATKKEWKHMKTVNSIQWKSMHWCVHFYRKPDAWKIRDPYRSGLEAQNRQKRVPRGTEKHNSRQHSWASCMWGPTAEPRHCTLYAPSGSTKT